MADYHPLISRAVEGLGASTGEARRALYERARAALVSQLRSIEPALSEADITRERLALEDAIRKVEAEAVRKSRTERPPAAPPRAAAAATRVAPPSERAAPGALRPDLARPTAPRAEPPSLRLPSETAPEGAPRPAAAESARSRLLNARTSPILREGLKGFRDVVREVDDLGGASTRSAQSAKETRDVYSAPASYAPDDELPLHDRLEPGFDLDEPRVLDEESIGALEPAEEAAEEAHFAPPHGPRLREAEEHYEAPRPPRSYRGLARIAVVLIVLAGVVATVSWQWSHIVGVYNFVSHMRSRPTQTAQPPAAQPKFSGRVPQEQIGQAPAAGAAQQNLPAVAQRVVLYEEDSNNPQGKQFIGSAVWRTETVSPGTGLAPELEVRADITIPDRNMTVTWTLRRNTDQALPASHTIEIMFNLPSDFPGGGIANVPGILMKDSEQARGVPLAGLAVKVTNGFFLIGLSAVDADVQRNIQLLKERPWFDIPIVYNNGGRAILAMEKGPPGDRAFADAFAAWGK